MVERCSVGKIARHIGDMAMDAGWESWMAYGRGNPASRSKLIRIGRTDDILMHGLESRILGNHGLASRHTTRRFVERIDRLSPDIVHLHNIHGYFLNYPILFDWLKRWGGPVVWTLHDCWPFTGHCAYYSHAGCDRWTTGCHDCPQLGQYPASVLRDNSRRNYETKRTAFAGMPNLTLVAVSEWIRSEISKSFLREYPVSIIRNGIDTGVFCPSDAIGDSRSDSKRVLGVANVWDGRKGLEDFVNLRALLPKNYEITLVGLKRGQIASLPQGIRGVERTDSAERMAAIYAGADVFVNPTVDDNFPTTALEAMACGTPVVTYATGGCGEAIGPECGAVVAKKDVVGLAAAIREICGEATGAMRQACRRHALAHFDKDVNLRNYIGLYASLLK